MFPPGLKHKLYRGGRVQPQALSRAPAKYPHSTFVVESKSAYVSTGRTSPPRHQGRACCTYSCPSVSAHRMPYTGEAAGTPYVLYYSYNINYTDRTLGVPDQPVLAHYLYTTLQTKPTDYFLTDGVYRLNLAPEIHVYRGWVQPYTPPENTTPPPAPVHHT